MWKTRELVSRALSLMLTEQDCVEVVREIYARVSLSDQNTLHGLLCIVSRILKDREKLVGCVVEVEEYGRKPLSHILLRLHLQKWWIGSK